MVAKSKNPAGPFVDPIKTDLGFDPGVLVDDDGRVYAYWGFCGAYCCELNEDMATIKEGTLHAHPMGHAWVPWDPQDDGHIDEKDAFYEASSPRKVMGKYVYLYSKRYFTPVPELGVFTDNNGFLSYKFSDSPLEGFEHGGDISFNGGEILQNADGTGTMTYQWGNNHGGIMEIGGKWYVFYHRQTGVNEFSRQAMLEPIDVAMDENGKLFIGDITYKNGQPVSSKPVEMTSQGPHINGLDARKIISAGYACHTFGGSKRPYVKAVYEETKEVSAPVVDITKGVTVGFRYLQFGANAPKSVSVEVKALADLTVEVRLDDYQGKVVAKFDMKAGESVADAVLTSGIIGKHAVYFAFLSESEDVIAEFSRFTFD